MDLDQLQKHRITAECAAFIEAISVDHVCSLASMYNDNKPCHKFADTRKGSYNACFFVEFDEEDVSREDQRGSYKKRWVVRFPLPSVHDPVAKISSEIATMKYVAKKTTIPIAEVHGYGFGLPEDAKNPTGLPFMVVDFIEGKVLGRTDLPNLAEATTQRFYAQLADFFIQLRVQEFSEIGSLTLEDDRGNDPWTVSGPPMTLDINDQEVYHLEPSKLHTKRKYKSTVDYIFSIYHLLYNRFDKQRNSVYDEADAKAKIYALEHFKGILFDFANPEYNHGPFVLMHGDLRPSNIIVDDDYNLKGIVDWEWSRIVPVQLFIPPTWLTGYDAMNAVRIDLSTDYYFQYMKLRREIRNRRLQYDPAAVLFRDWERSDPNSNNLWIASALHRFCDFEGIFWDCLYMDYVPLTCDNIVEEYFKMINAKKFSKIVDRKLKDLAKYQIELNLAGLATTESGLYEPAKKDESVVKATCAP